MLYNVEVALEHDEAGVRKLFEKRNVGVDLSEGNLEFPASRIYAGYHRDLSYTRLYIPPIVETFLTQHSSPL